MHEMQMEQTSIDIKERVTYLINLMPLDVINIRIIRTKENDHEIQEHDYINIFF